MSEEQQTAEPTKQGSSARSAILYGVLALMVVALIYDYKVARPAVSADYDKVTEASTKANGIANDFLTNLEVRELLGKEPVETFSDGGETVEVFSYMGGLIVKPHKLFVAYRKSGDELMFSRHAKFAYDESNSVGPTQSVVIEKPADDDEGAIEGYGESLTPMGAPGGAPPASAGAPAGGGGPVDSSAYAPKTDDAESPAESPAEESTDGDSESPAGDEAEEE
ncbi:hypothetical protein [Rhodopirellula sp. MGV]|uniref:hypothetical protein n=1 Tax=Rhodopirellula sp. MGV TaxID=2023130 RepID=UPI000B971B84|nr:hypothetical protein [Rhodopirellula sp. MGV]OYP36029.1 hypothetical protein CGZ80_09760 [Rhodopirellula sp. MGV]PNY36613.1 hypothetical protein C2E31_12245 [Rhodopirellula baltica]